MQKYSERLINNPLVSKATINIETGILHNTLKEAYDTYPSINTRWKYNSVCEMMTVRPNKTFLRYI